MILEQAEKGEFSDLLAWLREAVHQLGRKLLPTELVERATGKPLQAGLYVDYLKSKYAEIYGI